MTVFELYRFFEDRFPKSSAAEWDNDGAACMPAPEKQVRRVLIALDATEAVVERAVAGGFDLLLTHHPLLFRAVGALTPFTAVPRKLLSLIGANVAAISYHTRLDVARGGVNDVLASLLGLSEVMPFAPEGEIPCGRIGNLPVPVSAEDFAEAAKRALGVPALLLSGTGMVQRIAVCGGEGGDFLAAAKAAGADLLLSGRIGYHRMLDAPEEGIVAIEAGHYATEYPVCEALAAWVAEADPTIEIELVTAPPLKTV